MRDFLLKILSIIDYKGNKEGYVEKALTLISLNSFNSLLLNTDQVMQAQIKSKLSTAKSLEDLQKIVTKYFSKEQINQ